MPPWNSNILPHLNRRSPLIWRNILHHSYHIMLLFLLALIPRTFFPWKSWNLYGTSRTYTAYARQKNCELKKSQNIRSIKILRNKPKTELLKTPFFFSSSFPSTLANCSISLKRLTQIFHVIYSFLVCCVSLSYISSQKNDTFTQEKIVPSFELKYNKKVSRKLETNNYIICSFKLHYKKINII